MLVDWVQGKCGEFQLPRDNRRAALATGSSVERQDFLAELQTTDPESSLERTTEQDHNSRFLRCICITPLHTTHSLIPLDGLEFFAVRSRTSPNCGRLKINIRYNVNSSCVDCTLLVLGLYTEKMKTKAIAGHVRCEITVRMKETNTSTGHQRVLLIKPGEYNCIHVESFTVTGYNFQSSHINNNNFTL